MWTISKAFIMKCTFTQGRFFSILSNWLKRDGSLRAFGEALEGTGIEKLSLAGAGCSFETFCTEKEGKKYTAVRCTKDADGATGTMDAIYEQASDGSQKVYLHINGLSEGAGSASGFGYETVRMFAGSRYAEKGMIPVSDRSVEASIAEEGWLIPAISGQHTEDMAVVIISQPFYRADYDADADALAKALEGVACIVCADRRYTWQMRRRGYILPYNGAAAIYMNGSRRGLYRPDPAAGVSLTETLLKETLRLSSMTELPSWESLTEEGTGMQGMHAQDTDMNELLEDAFSANTSLEKEVRELKEKVTALSAENSMLLSRASRRKSSTDAPSADFIIRKGDVPEFYDEEQYDMIISILQNALANCTADTRQKELLEQVLANNPIRGNGKEIFDTVKRVFTSGRRLTAKDASDLSRVGIRIVSDNKHYKLVFKDNSKYMFILSKTPSDHSCTGKNMASEIISRLSVYKKA
ncbi:MAG: hypothetical protein LUD51_05155 [Clostridia bacterium]|nr:hypothetical protein [Clostridia bacterium]